MKATEIEKTYKPQEIEDKIYETWLQAGYFTPDVNDQKKPPFSIVIPPPNVTGQLHMGHALDETFQDILIRYKRMKGFNTLWIPGTDHAGIATQIKVEEQLRVEEGKTRYDLGREKFLERVWDWKEKYGNRIIQQIQKLGCSCDFTRERFTMDEGCSRAVREVFVNLYEKGLIYQGSRIINWCPKCTTALSDAEVEHSEQGGHFWHIKYPFADGSGFVEIATTRPETMLGDTAVAVNPNDERYQKLIGKMLVLPLVNREIPLIADEYVDMEFGTGAVKITPAHDPNDYEVGLRHDLEQINIMNDDATINANGGAYEGMSRYDARKQIVADLEAQGLLVHVEDHTHNVGQCYRCSSTVEPLISKQWFVKMEPLAEEAIKIVEDGGVQFVPDRFSKTYMNWMNNVHDWCISRQLWWGHRIPAFYCGTCQNITVSKEDITVCPQCGGPVHQDEDVLDTWFSSALWPFSTLGWPDKTPELAYYYPTSVLVTGYDIIFFWVARMIFSGMEHMKQEPFKHVFIHGLVRDAQGRKMSKSLGNGIDPLEVTEQFGADALRFTLTTGNSPGNDMRFQTERLEASRNFANKIWNASRFVLMNLDIDTLKLPEKLELEDQWIVSSYNELVREVTENFDKFELGIAVSKLYDFIWDEFCDWYIEIAKLRLYGDDAEKSRACQHVLTYVLSNTLKLLHPVMPFLTEEIWQHLPHEGESIMVSSFPEYDPALCFGAEQAQMEQIKAAIKAIRNKRAEMNVAPSKRANLYIITEDRALFEKGARFFEKLASAGEVFIQADKTDIPENSVSIAIENGEILIPFDELVDRAKELERLSKEKENLAGEIARAQGKLSNEKFVSKAPEKLVAEEKEKLEKYTKMLQTVMESIRTLEN